MSLKALSVASELFPLVKTGGLAEVTGALPRALQGQGIEVRSLIPGYPAVLARLGDGETVHHFADLFGGEARLVAADLPDGLEVLVIDAPHLYDRPGGPYTGPDGADWPDNARRFAALAWVAAELGRGLLAHWVPDLVHAHDWQAGLTPAYLALSARSRPATLMTIHNLAYQGRFAATLLNSLRLPHSAFALHGVEYFGGIGFLKAGIYFADYLSTVSPTYAQEIQTPAEGRGLEGLLQSRSDRLIGIVNGIDDATWNPAADPHLPKRYTTRTLALRSHNRKAVQQRFGLAGDEAAPLFCVISRLVWQKGMDLLLSSLPRLARLGAQIAVLGSGDADLERSFAEAGSVYSGQVGAVLEYDEMLAHLLQGGADAILIPSRFEPCGLTQLCGLRYGCVPVVSRVGGLADTIIDANHAAVQDGAATGFQISPASVEALEDGLSRVVMLLRNRNQWRRLQRRGMTRKLGWDHAAEHYAALYRAAVALRR